MTPPINIDGTNENYSNVTIDGQDVTQITIDGQDVLSTIPDSITSRTADDSSGSRTVRAGVGFVPITQWPDIGARISSMSSGVTKAYLINSNNNVIESTNVNGTSGETFKFTDVNLQPNNKYAIAVDAGGGTWTRGFTDDAGYPYPGPDLDITEGYIDGFDGPSQQPRAVNDIGNPDGVL